MARPGLEPGHHDFQWSQGRHGGAPDRGRWLGASWPAARRARDIWGTPVIGRPVVAVVVVELCLAASGATGPAQLISGARAAPSSSARGRAKRAAKQWTR